MFTEKLGNDDDDVDQTKIENDDIDRTEADHGLFAPMVADSSQWIILFMPDCTQQYYPATTDTNQSAFFVKLRFHI